MARACQPRPGERSRFFASLADELCEFARHQFRLNKRGEDGETLRQSLESAARQGNRAARAQLDAAPECPEGLHYLWAWFLRLNATRPIGIGGGGAISETEIRAFFHNRGLTPQPWEMELIERLDFEALRRHDEE